MKIKATFSLKRSITPSSVPVGEHVLQLSEKELDSIRDSSLALQRTLGRIGMGQREISSE